MTLLTDQKSVPSANRPTLGAQIALEDRGERHTLREPLPRVLRVGDVAPVGVREHHRPEPHELLGALELEVLALRVVPPHGRLDQILQLLAAVRLGHEHLAAGDDVPGALGVALRELRSLGGDHQILRELIQNEEDQVALEEGVAGLGGRVVEDGGRLRLHQGRHRRCRRQRLDGGAAGEVRLVSSGPSDLVAQFGNFFLNAHVLSFDELCTLREA